MKKKIIVCSLVAVLLVSVIFVSMAVSKPDMPKLSEEEQILLSAIEEKLKDDDKTFEEVFDEWVSDYEEDLANAKTDEEREIIQKRIDNIEKFRNNLKDYYEYYKQSEFEKFWKGLWD